MNSMRWLLATAGAAGIGFGAYHLYDLLTVEQAQSLGLWLVGGLVLHDMVLAPAMLLVGAVLWRVTRRLPAVAARILMGGWIVAGLLTLIALPAIYRENVRSNHTLLFMDYRRNLLFLLVAAAVITTLTAGTAAYLASRRRKRAEHPAG